MMINEMIVSILMSVNLSNSENDGDDITNNNDISYYDNSDSNISDSDSNGAKILVIMKLENIIDNDNNSNDNKNSGGRDIMQWLGRVSCVYF